MFCCFNPFRLFVLLLWRHYHNQPSSIPAPPRTANITDETPPVAGVAQGIHARAIGFEDYSEGALPAKSGWIAESDVLPNH